MTLRFALYKVNGSTITDILGENKTGSSRKFKIPYNSTLTVEKTTYTNGLIKNITFKFTTKDGDESYFRYFIKNNMYYITDYDFTGENITDDLTVSILGVEKKTYGVTFN